MAPSKENIDSSDGISIIARPVGQLHDLPVEFRWEVTRRHPYYLVFWQNALRYSQGNQTGTKAEQYMQHIAHLMLGAIGVTGEPVDPKTSFEQLDGGVALDPGFLSGAVQPMSLRAVATMLLNALPPDELTVLGALFNTAGSKEYRVEGDDDRLPQQRMQAISQLATIASPSLDSYPVIPLFYIHLGASQRTIVKDVETQVRRWKKRRGIDEKRIHTKKLQSYLEVWDLREGWTGKGYDVSQEFSLKDIGKKLKADLSTVASRYRSAFLMITGHEFSPNLWVRLVCPLKRSCFFQSAEKILASPLRHRLRSPVLRPVPDSVVTPPSDEAKPDGIVAQESITMGDQEQLEQWMDVEELWSRGRSKEEIARQLKCSEEDVHFQIDRMEEFKGKFFLD